MLLTTDTLHRSCGDLSCRDVFCHLLGISSWWSVPQNNQFLWKNKTHSFGTLNVQVPIILSHLRQDVQENVQDIWSFRQPALLVIDNPSNFNPQTVAKFEAKIYVKKKQKTETAKIKQEILFMIWQRYASPLTMLCERFQIYILLRLWEKKTVKEQYGQATLVPNLRHFFYCYGKTQLLFVVEELVSVEEPVSAEIALSAHFSWYGRKINILESCRF